MPNANTPDALWDTQHRSLSHPCYLSLFRDKNATPAGLALDEDAMRPMAVCLDRTRGAAADPASAADTKKDRYPSKNRAAFAFQQAQLINSQLHRRSHYTVPHSNPIPTP